MDENADKAHLNYSDRLVAYLMDIAMERAEAYGYRRGRVHGMQFGLLAGVAIGWALGAGVGALISVLAY